MRHTSSSGLAAAALVAVLAASAAVAIAHESAPSAGAGSDVKITDNAAQLPFAPTAENPSSSAVSAFVYRGREISSEQAANGGLSCVQQAAGQGLCFGTGRELDRYENIPSMAASIRNAERGTRVLPAASVKQTRAGRQYAHASSHTSCCPLMLWEHANYGGWRMDLSTSGKWFDIPSGYNDNASSYYAGAHTGYIYENYIAQGGGWLVTAKPYVHGCLCGKYNDEASSRARAG